MTRNHEVALTSYSMPDPRSKGKSSPWFEMLSPDTRNQKYKHMANTKIGALWSKKTTEGKEYFTGVISDLRGDIQIVVFRNDKKQNDNQPDYDILLSEPKEEK